MSTHTEAENRTVNYGAAGRAASINRSSYVIASNDDYQQMVAEAAFIEAQRRATELVLSGSGRHEF
jgi:hypothetical protein